MALGGDADELDDVRMIVLFQYSSLLKEFHLYLVGERLAAGLDGDLNTGRLQRSTEHFTKLALNIIKSAFRLFFNVLPTYEEYKSTDKCRSSFQ